MGTSETVRTEATRQPVLARLSASSPDLKELLDRMELDRLRPTAGVLCGTYLVFAAGHAALLAETQAKLLTLLALASAACYGGFALTFRRAAYSPRWSHAIAAALSGLTLLNSIVYLHFTGNPWQTTNFALVILASGMLFLSYTGLAAIVALALAAFAGIAWTHPTEKLWVHFGFLLITASIIAFLAQIASIRMVARLAGMKGRLDEMRLRLSAEDALRKSRLRNQQLVNAIPDLIFRVDVKGRLLDYHARNEDELFASPSEFMGRLVDDLLPPEHASTIVENIQLTVETGQTQIFEYELSKQGLKRHYECRMVYCQGDEVLAFSRDISARKRSEKELREAERRYRALVERVPAVIYTREVHGEGECSYVSPRISALGHSQDEWLADPNSWNAWLHPGDRDRVQEKFWNSRRNAEPFLAEYRVLDRAGRAVWIRDEATLVCGEDGTPLYWQGIAVDVTQRRKEEAETQKLQAEMQHAEKLKSLGLMAGGIAHDFNNLLVGILGNAELALERLEYDQPARGNIQEIQLAGGRAADLTQQMLAYAGRGRFRVETVNLGEALTGIKPLVASAVSKKAAIFYDLPETLLLVDADVTQIRQVILNLLINAAEALGGAAGEIQVKAGFIDTSLESPPSGNFEAELDPGQYVSLEFTDNGCGMDEQTAARIFEPFFTTKFAGRGLGLAAVRGIIHGHGGGIDVTSVPGKGSTFRVLLPRSKNPAALVEAASAELAARTAPAGNGVILLVDDEEVVRSVAGVALKNAGFEVITACHGEDALRVFRLESERIAVAVVDVMMPRMDGLQTYRGIRQVSKNVPVIFMSGYGRDGAREEWMEIEGAPFIKKPFTPRTLVDEICRLVDGIA